MAETAKFRKEETPTGWDAAKQSFRQSPAAGAVTAVANTARNVLSIPGAIMKAGEEAGRNFDFAQGSTGGLMPPAALAETERVRQELNPNGASVLVNALPKMATAAVDVPQNFRAAATDPANRLADFGPYGDAPAAADTPTPWVAPATAGSWRGAPQTPQTAQVPVAEQDLSTRGAYGESNLVTGRFRDGGTLNVMESPEQALAARNAERVAAGGAAINQFGRTAADQDAQDAIARQRDMDWRADNRATNARDVATFNATKDMPFWERNNMSNKLRLGVAAIGEQAAQTALSGQSPRAALDVYAGEKVRQTGEVAAAQAGKFRAEAESEPLKAAAAQAKAVADAKGKAPKIQSFDVRQKTDALGNLTPGIDSVSFGEYGTLDVPAELSTAVKTQQQELFNYHLSKGLSYDDAYNNSVRDAYRVFSKPVVSK